VETFSFHHFRKSKVKSLQLHRIGGTGILPVPFGQAGMPDLPVTPPCPQGGFYEIVVARFIEQERPLTNPIQQGDREPSPINWATTIKKMEG
jgi:hypothetical protein